VTNSWTKPQQEDQCWSRQRKENITKKFELEKLVHR